VPQEALIGIVYVMAAAAGILMLSKSAEGDEELKRTLVGDILLVQPGEVFRAFGLYVVIGIIHFMFRQRFLTISFVPEQALASGWSVRGWDFLFYVLFGFVVTSFVHIGGVLMIFSYLIVPAVCANLLAGTLKVRLLIGWLTATVASVAGLYVSYKSDLPTGASIVCALGAVLVLVMLAARFVRRGAANDEVLPRPERGRPRPPEKHSGQSQ
jgi:zinc/manganese transport system permease protein